MSQKPTATREHRYERKFYVDMLDANQAISLVKRHPAMFSEIYPPRFVNNLYFDTCLLENYFQNVDGASQRKKVRLRWYHELFRQVDHPVLELKLKEGLMGTKISYPFPGFAFQTGLSMGRFRELARSSDLPEDVADLLLSSESALVNRYRRWYFATPERDFRVTIDSGLVFYHLNKLDNQFLFHQENRRSIVVELKYQRELDIRADRVCSGFPFRMTRSSKYIQGVDLVYL